MILAGHDGECVGQEVMPTKSVPRRTAMTVSVVAAFLPSGGLKAGTPLATPPSVSATDPLANARRSSRMVTA
jgi:hypothetical protein